jgi:hypothetical protein
MDEVSVMRRAFVDDQFSKDKAKDIELSGACKRGDMKEFRGFAVISAAQIRQCGSMVVDSRHVYLTHADIIHGFVPVKNEPLPAWLNDRLDGLKELARFTPDPDPNRWRWIGPALT